MTGYHTRWVRPPDQAEDPERVAIREALAFGKAVYDQRCALGLSVAELAGRADMTVDEIECIEEGGTEPTIALLRRLAAALDADVRLTAGHDLGSVWFEPHAALPARRGRFQPAATTVTERDVRCGRRVQYPPRSGV
jgi:transcriptional regulator with XRE-family HTH domain